MRPSLILSAVITAIILGVGFKDPNASGISGRFTPAASVTTIYVIKGTDSLKTIPANGAFMMEATPGFYKVILDAKPPYRDVSIESVEVIEGKNTDLGEIKITE